MGAAGAPDILRQAVPGADTEDAAGGRRDEPDGRRGIGHPGIRGEQDGTDRLFSAMSGGNGGYDLRQTERGEVGPVELYLAG